MQNSHSLLRSSLFKMVITFEQQNLTKIRRISNWSQEKYTLNISLLIISLHSSWNDPLIQRHATDAGQPKTIQMFGSSKTQCAVSKYLVILGPWFFFNAATVLLILMDLVMMVEQTAHIFSRMGPLLGAWGAPVAPQVGPKCLKWV